MATAPYPVVADERQSSERSDYSPLPCLLLRPDLVEVSDTRYFSTPTYFSRLIFLFLFFKMESQASPGSPLASDLPTSAFQILPGITDMHHGTQFYVGLRIKPGASLCQASTLPTGLQLWPPSLIRGFLSIWGVTQYHSGNSSSLSVIRVHFCCLQ